MPRRPVGTVEAVADLTANGFADIILQNASSAADVLYADMHGGIFNGWVAATTPLTPGYAVVGASGFAGWDAVTTGLDGHCRIV